MQEDNTLVADCIKGDRAAQQALYQKYSARMMTVSLRYCRCREDAEDVLQESFVKVFNHIETFRQDATLAYWIKRIVINTALNYHRKSVYLYPHLDVDEVHTLGSDDATLSNYHFNELLQLLQTLPQGCQVIFNLHAIEGYKHREIATMLQISEGTSKSQYARARSLLQEMITEKGEVKHG